MTARRRLDARNPGSGGVVCSFHEDALEAMHQCVEHACGTIKWNGQLPHSATGIEGSKGGTGVECIELQPNAHHQYPGCARADRHLAFILRMRIVFLRNPFTFLTLLECMRRVFSQPDVRKR